MLSSSCTAVLWWSADPRRQYVRFLGESNAIAGGEALQLIHYAGADLRAHLGSCGGDDGSDRRCGQMVECKFIETGKVGVEPTDAHLDRRKACGHGETQHFVAGGDLPRSTKADGGLVVYKLSESLPDGTVVKPGIGPHAECEATTRPEHAAHVREGSRLIWKKLQSLLTKNHVKTAIIKSKLECVTLKPFDWRCRRVRERTRNADHGTIEVDTNHPPGGTDTLCRDASYDAGATSDIQHPLAFSQASKVDKQGRPRSQDIASDVAFVEFGSLRAQVPWLLLGLGHLAIHPSLRDMRCAVCVTALICCGGGDAGMYWIEPAMATAPTKRPA